MKNQPKADKADKDNKKQAESAMALPIDFLYKFCFRKPLTSVNHKMVPPCDIFHPINNFI